MFVSVSGDKYESDLNYVANILFSLDNINYRFIKNLMGLSGFSVREDAVGNIFGRW